MTKVDILIGDNRETLKTLPDKSVQCCITSPPYFGLRDYQTGKWEGGDENCSHSVGNQVADNKAPGAIVSGVRQGVDASTCKKCGAKRVDSQIGLEKTPNEYVQELVKVFREVKRILKDDGVLWLNIGDSYASFRDGKATPDTTRGDSTGTLVSKGIATNRMASTFAGTSIKHKDLIGVPWMLAFALRDDGWWLRQDIIWSKPSPMPESVTDRCTKSHEYIFLLSRNSHYYFDHQSIKEPTTDLEGFRNKRSVWNVATKPFKGSHFAVFPQDLIEPCVLAGSKPGDIVLDPFGGAGTTGLVAKIHKRNTVLCELNPEYAEMARTRIDGDPIFRDLFSDQG